MFTFMMTAVCLFHLVNNIYNGDVKLQLDHVKMIYDLLYEFAVPIVTVTGVSSYRYNSTAIMVTWAPVNNSREVMKGIIQGYQVSLACNIYLHVIHLFAME